MILKLKAFKYTIFKLKGTVLYVQERRRARAWQAGRVCATTNKHQTFHSQTACQTGALPSFSWCFGARQSKQKERQPREALERRGESLKATETEPGPTARPEGRPHTELSQPGACGAESPPGN